jgi:hypothetical protein
MNAWPQQTTDKSDQPTCGYSELYQEAGWLVSGLDGAKKKTARTAVPSKAGVYLTILEPTKHELSVQVFRCSRTHIGRLEIVDITVGIGDLYAFDVGGRIFAYGMVYGIDGVAAEWPLIFYDVDGSGRFTVRRSEMNRFAPELIPEWVNDTKANQR